ncbi:MAG TPA: glycosyltransferase [Acidimicrobiales bacterium]|nr:glycosyltransferase [Acidimicrobiales bacterium]
MTSRRPAPRSLAVIADLPHHRDAAGRLYGLEPVVAQLDEWAALFDRLVICSPVLPGAPPAGFAPYRSSGIEMVDLPRGGGNTLGAKLAMIPLIPGWAWRTRRVARRVDAVHLRCPSNIGLVAVFSTWRAARYRSAMYAGVWRHYDGEPRFFRLQRELLRGRWFGGPVSVYAPADPRRPHLEPSFSPSFTHAAWEAAAPTAEAKRDSVSARPDAGVWRLAVVGRLTPNKNQQAAVRAVADLAASGLDVELDVLGDGPERGRLELLARDLGLGDRVRFRGMVPFDEVTEVFAAADLQLLPSRQEGYGKVLLEGMVQGTVPLLSPGPAADGIAGHGSRGLLIDPHAPATIAAAVRSLIDDRPRWLGMIDDARAYTAEHTLEVFRTRLRAMLERQWDVDLAGVVASDQ